MSGGAGTRPEGSGEATEQLALVPAPAPTPPGGRSRRRKSASERPGAEVDPVAAVLVDTGLPHLDRPFEYLVPADLDVDARPGCRVRVRFAGRDHDGFLLERRAEPDHPGRLAALRSVVSPEGVLTPAVLAAATSVAEHYGGTLADVLRLAIPPRHARAERGVSPRAGDTATDPRVPAPTGTPSPAPTGTPSPAPTGPQAAPTDRPLGAGPWDPYPAGPAFLRRTEAGESPAAAWTALPARGPGTDWPAAVAAAVGAALRGGRGAVVVVPDHRDVDRVVDAVTAEAGEGVCARLTADLGPEARYRAFLSLLRGHARVAVGTRSAAWAPVVRPGLFVCWDDGDDLHQEPRAPYHHVREVLLERARHEEAALLVGGYARSVELEAWAAAGVVARIEPPRTVVRSCAPRVTVAGEGRAEERDPAARTARIPSTAWRALRDGLTLGPVLVQVPRQGYVVSLTCAEPGCRTPARCPRCEGPVGLVGAAAAATCRWCGHEVPRGAGCRSCGSPRLRAAGVGAGRTAEELGRAFPGARVVRSGGEHVVARVPDAPALVVATPGAEPVAEEGYRAVVLLDGWLLLDRAALDASVEAHRRWLSAAALVRGTRGDGPRPGVVLCGVPAHAGVPAVEALVRWDPVSLAARELAERTTLGLPPVRRHVTVSGPGGGVRDVVEALEAAGQIVLGAPSPAGPDGRRATVVREGAAGTLAPAVRAVRATRSARKAEDSVRLVLDVAEASS